MSYEYEPSQCDVQDKTQLIAFRQKRDGWLSLIEEDAVHPISHQISAMLWNDAAYRTFNEARRFSTPDRSLAAVAPLLAEFVDVGYIATQILSIGRLLDKNPANPNKAVVSLRRLVDDVANNRDLFTRELYVSFDGLPYDYSPLERAHVEAVIKEGGVKARWLEMKGPTSWAGSQLAHQEFDRLSGVSAGSRQRSDVIHSSVFDRLVAALDDPVLQELLLHRHKLLAHAADQTNRPEVFAGLTLDKFAQAHRLLMQVTFVLSAEVLRGTGVGGVPTPQFNHFEFLEAPFVRSEHMDELAEYWNQHSSEREGWLMSARSDILKL